VRPKDTKGVQVKVRVMRQLMLVMISIGSSVPLTNDRLQAYATLAERLCLSLLLLLAFFP